MSFLHKLKQQFKLLYESSYNRKHPIYALYRFVYWNVCKLLKRDFEAVLWNYKFKFWISSHQSYWLYKNYYLDTKEFDLIKSLIRPGNVIFDIGANIGVYSLWFSKCIEDKGKIYSFEPDEVNLNRIKYAISLNGINSILLNNVALSNEIGEAKFSIGLDEQNSLINDSSSSNEKFRIVNTNTIDNFCDVNSIEEIHFMKMDVEGAEWFVLNGAKVMLEEKRIKIIQLEINSQLLKFNVDVNQLVDFMNDFGYKIFRLNSKFIEIDLSKENLLEEDSNNYYFISDMDYILNASLK